MAPPLHFHSFEIGFLTAEQTQGGMSMIVVTTETVPGHRIQQVLGLVRGNTIRARHLGRDIMAGFKSMVGGEIKSYTDLLTRAREEALSRMVEDAQRMGANAVLNLRFTTSSVMQGAAELFAYGTAAVIQPEQGE